MTAANPEPTDGSWAVPAGSGANPHASSGDGTWPTADAPPPQPPAPDATAAGPGGGPGSAPLDALGTGLGAATYGSSAGPWATPPSGWHPAGTPAAPGAAPQEPGGGPHRPDAPPHVRSGQEPPGAGAPALGAEPASGDPLGAAGPPPGDAPWEASAPRLPRKQRLGAAGLTAVVVAVVGAPLGLLWSLIAPGVPIIKTDDGAVFATPSPEEFIASDGWFTILLFALGVVAALVTWIGFKRYRGPLTLVALMVGTVGASVLAWQVGRRIGIGDYRAAVLAAQPGDMITRPPDLRAGGFTNLWDVVPFVHGDLLIATFGAVIVYTLLAGWSRTPSLRPETRVPPPVAQPTNPFYVLNDPAPGARPADPPAPGAAPPS